MWWGRQKPLLIEKEVLTSGTRVEFAEGGRLLRGVIMGRPLPGLASYHYYIKVGTKTYLIIEHAIQLERKN